MAKVLCDRNSPCTRCVRLGCECKIPQSVPRGRPSRARLIERAAQQKAEAAALQRQQVSLLTMLPDRVGSTSSDDNTSVDDEDAGAGDDDESVDDHDQDEDIESNGE